MAHSRGGDIGPILNVVRAHLDHLNAICCHVVYYSQASANFSKRR